MRGGRQPPSPPLGKGKGPPPPPLWNLWCPVAAPCGTNVRGVCGACAAPDGPADATGGHLTVGAAGSSTLKNSLALALALLACFIALHGRCLASTGVLDKITMKLYIAF